jgi:hypothetical protein
VVFEIVVVVLVVDAVLDTDVVAVDETFKITVVPERVEK